MIYRFVPTETNVFSRCRSQNQNFYPLLNNFKQLVNQTSKIRNSKICKLKYIFTKYSQCRTKHLLVKQRKFLSLPIERTVWRGKSEGEALSGSREPVRLFTQNRGIVCVCLCFFLHFLGLQKIKLEWLKYTHRLRSRRTLQTSILGPTPVPYCAPL